MGWNEEELPWRGGLQLAVIREIARLVLYCPVLFLRGMQDTGYSSDSGYSHNSGYGIER